MSFLQIPINTKEIEQSKLNIDHKDRSNTFAWMGQFSPQLIEVLLDKYAKPGFVILDPFAGSGTTLYECSRKGLSAYGIELNVSAFYMAKTYELTNLSSLEREQLILKIESFINCINEKEALIDALLKAPIAIKNQISLLIILLDIYNNEISLDLVIEEWKKIKKIIKELPYTANTIKALRGDARAIELKDNMADLLISSPPYINVFNYHQKYRRSVEALGYNVLSTAKTEIGSNRKNRGNRFLTVIQYCIDIGLSIKEACRVCKRNSRMVYIVGRESKVLGYSICNSELIYMIGTQIFNLSFHLRQERFFKNRYGQTIYEDILHFVNTCDTLPENDVIIESARNIAVAILQDKLLTNGNNKNSFLLIQAINKKHNVKQSEVLQ